jgi:methylenetetrahydrofolate dehydrogenase (NADP+)/methenyltetrahydrofolate cyclohydrolase
MADTSIIDGLAYAAALREKTRERAEAFLKKHGRKPRLDVIIVGNHPASRSYVKTKAKQAHEAGIEGNLIELAETISARELEEVIDRLNAFPEVDGILVQLPLPDHLNSASVLNRISPAKDVDGFHPLNAGGLFTATKLDMKAMLVPCTPLGCLMMLRSTLGDMTGKAAVVVGRSNIVGKPMAQLLAYENATVTVAHSRTADLPAVCRSADILVVAIGRPQAVRGDWIKPGAVVIDVGINRVSSGQGKSRLVGDVATEEALGIAGAITPVPGGVGPMTVACLLHNTLVAAELRVSPR